MINLKKFKFVLNKMKSLAALNEEQLEARLENSKLKEGIDKLLKSFVDDLAAGKRVRVKTCPHPDQPNAKFIYEGYEFEVLGVYTIWKDTGEIQYYINLEGSQWYKDFNEKHKDGSFAAYTGTTLREKHLIWIDGNNPGEEVKKLYQDLVTIN